MFFILESLLVSQYPFSLESNFWTLWIVEGPPQKQLTALRPRQSFFCVEFAFSPRTNSFQRVSFTKENIFYFFQDSDCLTEYSTTSEPAIGHLCCQGKVFCNQRSIHGPHHSCRTRCKSRENPASRKHKLNEKSNAYKVVSKKLFYLNSMHHRCGRLEARNSTFRFTNSILYEPIDTASQTSGSSEASTRKAIQFAYSHTTSFQS